MSVKYIIEYQGKELGGMPPIYVDDTIDTVKRKIILAMNQDIPYDGIYLYGIKNVEFTPERVFEIITQDGTLDLTHERLVAFLSNFVKKKRIKEEKTVYTVSDLYDLRLDHPNLMRFPIGISASGHKRMPYYFPVDPLTNDITNIDPFFLKYAENMISTQSGSLVMDLGDLQDNKMYMVLADELFDSGKDSIIKIYYPFLEKAKINTKAEYERKREKLLAQNKKFLSASVLKSYESVDLFHSIVKDSATPSSLDSGIKSIDFIFNQKKEMILPLEILFKVIHATREHPFVKFNPNTQQESLVRLFTEAQTVTGEKIPFLSKSVIMKLVKSVARKNALGIYICEDIVCTVYPNGSVEILCDFEEKIGINDVEERVKILVNPVLEQIQKYVEKSGIQFELFKDFDSNSNDITLKNMNFVVSAAFEKKFNLGPVMSCVSSVFNVTQSNLTKEGGIQMRYKRVTNYNEMEAIDAFIRTVINQGNLRDSVVSMIADNFDLTQEEANAKYIEFIGEEEVKMGMAENMRLRIRDNPGFKTSIEKENFKNILKISMEIEDNIKYLDIVPVFLQGLIEIGQGKHSDMTKKICTRKANVKDIKAPEIFTPSELPFSDNKTPIIEEGEELVFDDEGDDDMLDALLIGSDEDEDEDEDDEEGDGAGPIMIGGAKGDESVDITGMPLSNPNFFSKRMEERDPALFLKKSKGKFAAYSRMCASNMRRQPVVVSEEELDRIDREHPGSYSDDSKVKKEKRAPLDPDNPRKHRAIKYGSDPKKQFYYICPRYWSIPENTSLTDEEVEARKRGPLSINDPVIFDDDKSGVVVEIEDERVKIKYDDKEEWHPKEGVLKDIIIPPDAKKVPKGKTIYEFSVKKGARAYDDFIDENGEYITHYPGFISGDKHPDGLCMPCCFKSWDKPGSKLESFKTQCEKNMMDSATGTTASASASAKKVKSSQVTDYIKGHDKFPLEENRKGYLPIELQLFFQEDARQYQVSELDPSLKDDAITLLRMGVETSKNQSFIGSIARAYYDTSDDANYTRLYNEFLKEQRRKKGALTESKLQKYEKEFKIRVKRANPPSIKEMRQIIANSVTIDNFPNYQNGNLVAEFYPGNVDDVNIDDYSESVLYSKLDTSDEDQVYFFERLIAAYKNFIAYLDSDDNDIDYQYLWDIITTPNENLFPSGINLVILEIPQDDVTANVNIICPTNHYKDRGFDSNKRTLMLVKKNEFFEPIYLFDNLKEKISRFLFREQNLVGKPNIKLVLSKIRKYLNESCKPLNSMPREYTFKENLGLDEISKILEKKKIIITALEIHYNGKAIGIHIKLPDGDEGYIPCYPSNYEVKEDLELIFMDSGESKNRKGYEETIDFLRKVYNKTKLPCKPAYKIVEDDLIVGILTETNQLVMLNNPAELREGEDEDVALPVYNIKTYNEVSKAALSEKGGDKERIEFINRLRREKAHYNEFRNLVRVQLNKIGNHSIKESIIKMIRDEDRDSLKSYQKTIESIKAELEKLLGGIIEFIERGDGVNVEEHKYPKTNSLTGADNEEFYYIRLADELLRFQRIQLFMLESNKYLSFSDVHYQVNNDEILMIESMITQEFFQGLKAYHRNKFVHFNTYDTAMPIKTLPYSEKLTLQTVCDVKLRSKLTEKEHKSLGDGFSFYDFNPKAKEKRNTVCTYQLIITILENEKRRNERSKVHELDEINPQTLKEILIERYNEFDENKVLNLLYKDGKEQWIRSIRGGKLTLEQYIRSDQYAFTILDYWMLSDYFSVPIIFYGQYKMDMNNNAKAFATINKKGMYNYYIVRVYKPVINTLPHYNLVMDPDKSIYINLKKYSDKLQARFIKALTIKTGSEKIPVRKSIKISEYIEK